MGGEGLVQDPSDGKRTIPSERFQATHCKRTIPRVNSHTKAPKREFLGERSGGKLSSEGCRTRTSKQKRTSQSFRTIGPKGNNRAQVPKRKFPSERSQVTFHFPSEGPEYSQAKDPKRNIPNERSQAIVVECRLRSENS